MNTRSTDAVKTERKPVEPHPVLADYYTNAAQRPAFVRQLFDRTARYYDPINRLFSLGSGRWYRRRALRQAGLSPGMHVLDVATGTGLVAGPAAELTGHEGRVVGLDLSFGMLSEARRSLPLITFVQADAPRLPIADNAFDFLSIGYGLRHFGDLDAAFREFYRVLRPQGILLILEIGRPSPGLGQTLADFYIGRLIPWLSRWTAGRKEAQTLMRYYWATVEHCVVPETILETIASAGFSEPRCDVELGLFHAYVGRKD